jgi:hypothetical protein
LCSIALDIFNENLAGARKQWEVEQIAGARNFAWIIADCYTW